MTTESALRRGALPEAQKELRENSGNESSCRTLCHHRPSELAASHYGRDNGGGTASRTIENKVCFHGPRAAALLRGCAVVQWTSRMRLCQDVTVRSVRTLRSHQLVGSFATAVGLFAIKCRRLCAVHRRGSPADRASTQAGMEVICVGLHRAYAWRWPQCA